MKEFVQVIKNHPSLRKINACSLNLPTKEILEIWDDSYNEIKYLQQLYISWKDLNTFCIMPDLNLHSIFSFKIINNSAKKEKLPTPLLFGSLYSIAFTNLSNLMKMKCENK